MAAHDAEGADDDEPASHEERVAAAHRSSPEEFVLPPGAGRTVMACSNFASSTMTPEATSTPTTPLRSGTVPAEKSVPMVPTGMKLARKDAPSSMALMPRHAKAPAPIASDHSKGRTGRTRWSRR